VDAYSVEKEGAIEVRCSLCFFPIGVMKGESLRGLACIMITDDDRFFRTLLSDVLKERGLAQKVIPCESGAEFLALAAERISQNLPIKLAILDIVMTQLDGVATALALRAFERGLKTAQPIPILFLSVVPSDDTLKSIISQHQPALYLNKGSDASPGQAPAAPRTGDRLPDPAGKAIIAARGRGAGRRVRAGGGPVRRDGLVNSEGDDGSSPQVGD
jgi:CheY-like chemotaxis protein